MNTIENRSVRKTHLKVTWASYNVYVKCLECLTEWGNSPNRF